MEKTDVSLKKMMEEVGKFVEHEADLRIKKMMDGGKLIKKEE